MVKGKKGSLSSSKAGSFLGCGLFSTRLRAAALLSSYSLPLQPVSSHRIPEIRDPLAFFPLPGRRVGISCRDWNEIARYVARTRPCSPTFVNSSRKFHFHGIGSRARIKRIFRSASKSRNYFRIASVLDPSFVFVVFCLTVSVIRFLSKWKKNDFSNETLVVIEDGRLKL